jgi:hypothetical protein
MVVEESVIINADSADVWKIFTDLTGWKDWNRTARYLWSDSLTMTEGVHFRFRLHLFSVPVVVDPVIEKVALRERVVWSASTFGLTSHHEFLFEQVENGLLVTSRETLSGAPVIVARRTFLEKRFRKLAHAMLIELKNVCELRRGAKTDPAAGSTR